MTLSESDNDTNTFVSDQIGLTRGGEPVFTGTESSDEKWFRTSAQNTAEARLVRVGKEVP